MTQCLYFISSG